VASQRTCRNSKTVFLHPQSWNYLVWHKMVWIMGSGLCCRTNMSSFSD